MADPSLLSTIFRWLGFAQYNQTPPTVSNADFSPMQCDSRGRLIVNVGGYGGTDAIQWNDFAPTTSGVIKNNAGTLSTLYAGNCSGHSIFLMLFDANSVPSNGTTPKVVIPMSDGDADLWQFNRPRVFATGIVWAASTTASTLTLDSGAVVGLNAEYA